MNECKKEIILKKGPTKMKKKYDAVCIGFAVQDILMTNVPKDALSRDTSVASSATITSGGDAVNEAVTLGRLGSKTGLLVKLGTDSVGKSIYSTLEDEPVDLSLMVRDDEAQMILAIAMIQADGERSFIIRQANDNAYLNEDEITDAILKDTRAVTVGSLFCIPGLDGEPIASILQRAQSHGAFTVCDMTYDQFQIGPKAQEAAYPYIDYMMPSLEEATYVTGETDPDRIADYFLSRGVKNVLLKLGSKGCFFKNKEKRFFTDPYQVKAIDTTGCGDCCLGAFTHALLNEWSIEKCVDFACAVGAINATGVGAHHTLKNEAHVFSFMETTPRRRIDR